MKRVGLYFGSFNPIHTGHLIIAEYMREAVPFDQVWLVVSPANPFKDEIQLWPADKRLMLTNSAVSENPFLIVCDLEFSMPKPSYTSDTLRRLKTEYPEIEFSIIMGSDSLNGLSRWKDSAYIFENFHIHIYQRAGHDHHEDATMQQTTIHHAPYIDISATLIRDRLEAGLSIRYLVPDSVWSIIGN